MDIPGPRVSFYHIFLCLDDNYMETFFLKDNFFGFELFLFLLLLLLLLLFLIFFQLDVIFYAPE